MTSRSNFVIRDPSSFLPGPERIAPHLAEKAWKKCITKEEDFAISSANSKVARRQNPITWEDATPLSSRLNSSRSDRSANVLSLDSSRVGTAASSTVGSLKSVQSARSRTSGANRSRCGTSRRLGTAGSYQTNVPSEAGLSSMLSVELDVERKQRKRAEVELEKLKAELDDTRKLLEAKT